MALVPLHPAEDGKVRLVFRKLLLRELGRLVQQKPAVLRLDGAKVLMRRHDHVPIRILRKLLLGPGEHDVRRVAFEMHHRELLRTLREEADGVRVVAGDEQTGGVREAGERGRVPGVACIAGGGEVLLEERGVAAVLHVVVAGDDRVGKLAVQTRHRVGGEAPLEVVVHIDDVAGMRDEQDVLLLGVRDEPIDDGIELIVTRGTDARCPSALRVAPFSVVTLRIGDHRIRERPRRQRRHLLGQCIQRHKSDQKRKLPSRSSDLFHSFHDYPPECFLVIQIPQARKRCARAAPSRTRP